MASEVVLRQWWVIVRRGTEITQRLQVRILPDKRNSDVDPFVGPVHRDFDMVDPGADTIELPVESESVLATGELVSVTNAWEIQYVE